MSGLTVGLKKMGRQQVLNTIASPTPSTRLDFLKMPKLKSPYLLYKTSGQEIKDLCGRYKKGIFKSQKYILVEIAMKDELLKSRYNYFVYSTHPDILKVKRLSKPKTKKALISGFLVGDDGKAVGDGCVYGSTRNAALLFQFDSMRENLTIWVFAGMKNRKRELFNSWVSGLLNMAVEEPAAGSLV